MEWLINRRRMMYNKAVPPAYLTFEDEGIWRICCENFGDYNETVITDNGDGTVNIVVTFKSMLNNVVKKSKIISTQTNVDNTEGTYVEGTTKEAIGITMKQCKAVTSSSLGNNGTGPFAQEITVSNFREFRYFTGITYLPQQVFKNMTFTGTLILPGSITNFWTYSFNQGTYKAVVLDEGIVNPPSTWHVFYYCNTDILVLPSTLSSITNIYSAYNGGKRDVIINGDEVKTLHDMSGYYNTSRPFHVYVKDELVDAYKADESWSSVFNLDNIHPISEYTGTY